MGDLSGGWLKIWICCLVSLEVVQGLFVTALFHQHNAEFEVRASLPRVEVED